MKISDKNLGYLTFWALVATLCWITFAMYAKSSSTVNQLTLIFNDVGTLRPQDPITKQGMVIGSVTSIDYFDKSAKVVISFDNPLLLRAGTQFINYNYSLMGERRIKVIPSDTGEYLTPESQIKGEFEKGIAETMHQLADLNEQITLIRNFILLLHSGNNETPPLFKKVFTELSKTEALIETIHVQFNTLQPKLLSTIDQANALTQTGMEIIDTATIVITKLSQKSQELIGSANESIHTVSVTVDTLQSRLTTIEEMGILTNDSLFQGIYLVIDGLNTTLAAITNNGVGLTDSTGQSVGIFSFSNLNILGETAREKRAKKSKNNSMSQ
ncbi:MAG: MlaD family protein [Fibrobacterales bacterium]